MTELFLAFVSSLVHSPYTLYHGTAHCTAYSEYMIIVYKGEYHLRQCAHYRKDSLTDKKHPNHAAEHFHF